MEVCLLQRSEILCAVCFPFPELGMGVPGAKCPVLLWEVSLVPLSLSPLPGQHSVSHMLHVRGGLQQQEKTLSSGSSQEHLPSLCHSSGGCRGDQPQIYSQMLPAPKWVMLFFPGAAN